MSEDEQVPEEVESLYESLPHFPDGRINYSQADEAVTVLVFLRYEDEILLLKRSDRVGNHKGRWGLVAGYMDELKSILSKAREEVEEETGIEENKISNARNCGSYHFQDQGTDYTSYVVLMELSEKPDIQLSWEHTDHKWIKMEDVDDYLPYHAKAELEMAIED